MHRIGKLGGRGKINDGSISRNPDKERREMEKKLCLKKQVFFSFSTNLFLCGAPPHDPASPVRAYRKALPKELYFLSTGSFFRKKVFYEKEKVLGE